MPIEPLHPPVDPRSVPECLCLLTLASELCRASGASHGEMIHAMGTHRGLNPLVSPEDYVQHLRCRRTPELEAITEALRAVSDQVVQLAELLLPPETSDGTVSDRT